MITIERENTWLPLMDTGWGNGYVIIEQDHKLHGQSYNNIDVDVHGGLTYATNIKESFLSKEEINDLPEIYKNGWIVGFDTSHLGDNPNTWSKQDVIAETIKLKENLLKL